MKRNLLSNFAKKEVKTLKCKYGNLEYDFEIPVESSKPLTFKNILDDFGSKYFEKEKTFKDFDIERTSQINLNDKVIDHDLDTLFKIYDFDLTEKSLKDRSGWDYKRVLEFPFLYIYRDYSPGLIDRILPNVSTFLKKDFKKKVYNYESNYFNYLHTRYPEYSFNIDILNKYNKFHSNVEPEIIKHGNLDRINFDNMNSIKQLFIQILYPFIEMKKGKGQNYLIDIDYKLSGIDTNEYVTELVLKNTKNHIYIPITFIKPYNYEEEYKSEMFKGVKPSYKEWKTYYDISVQDHFERESFINHNLLKVLTRHRFNTSRRVQFGILVDNDRVRFNAYLRPSYGQIVNDECLGRSQYIDLNLNKDLSIQNMDEFKKFMTILDIITSVDNNKLSTLMEYHIKNNIQKVDADKLVYADLDDVEGVSEKQAQFYEELMAKLKH